MQLLVRRSPFQSNRSPFWYFRSTSRQARTDRRGGALKYRPMRTIGCLQSGHGNGRSGTLLSQLDEPICLKVLRQAKQAKWTLLVAVGTPGPFRIPATVVSSCAANAKADQRRSTGSSTSLDASRRLIQRLVSWSWPKRVVLGLPEAGLRR